MASKSKNLFLLGRAYKVGAEMNVRVEGEGKGKGKAKGVTMASSIREAGSESGGQKEVFWMRDPKTGNYIPENHFDEVDVAELRDKLLCKKHA